MCALTTAASASPQSPLDAQPSPSAPAPNYETQDWADFAHYAAANQTQARPTAVLMGDSITEFWAATRPAFFAENRYVGRGICGQTSAQMLVRFRADVLALKPQVVAILAGTNDVAENNGPIALENVLGNIASMAELARLHGIRVVLCSVTPALDFPWHGGLAPSEKIRKLNAMIADYAAKNGFAFVDYYAALVDARGGLSSAHSEDGVHLTSAAYAIIEPLLKAKIAP